MSEASGSGSETQDGPSRREPRMPPVDYRFIGGYATTSSTGPTKAKKAKKRAKKQETLIVSDDDAGSDDDLPPPSEIGVQSRKSKKSSSHRQPSSSSSKKPTQKPSYFKKRKIAKSLQKAAAEDSQEKSTPQSRKRRCIDPEAVSDQEEESEAEEAGEEDEAEEAEEEEEEEEEDEEDEEEERPKPKTRGRPRKSVAKGKKKKAVVKSKGELLARVEKGGKRASSKTKTELISLGIGTFSSNGPYDPLFKQELHSMVQQGGKYRCEQAHIPFNSLEVTYGSNSTSGSAIGSQAAFEAFFQGKPNKKLCRFIVPHFSGLVQLHQGGQVMNAGIQGGEEVGNTPVGALLSKNSSRVLEKILESFPLQRCPHDPNSPPSFVRCLLEPSIGHVVLKDSALKIWAGTVSVKGDQDGEIEIGKPPWESPAFLRAVGLPTNVRSVSSFATPETLATQNHFQYQQVKYKGLPQGQAGSSNHVLPAAYQPRQGYPPSLPQPPGYAQAQPEPQPQPQAQSDADTFRNNFIPNQVLEHDSLNDFLDECGMKDYAAQLKALGFNHDSKYSYLLATAISEQDWKEAKIPAALRQVLPVAMLEYSKGRLDKLAEKDR
ncbi:hypothetical protein JCM5350_005173 [Sporobolomyces pararoseus]